MRELKFRIYNPKVKEIGEAFTLIEAMTDEFAMSDDLVYMQYTCLKDKNGKEIYEGDIVECHIDIGIKSESWRTERAVVVFENGYFTIDSELMSGTLAAVTSESKCEVIGNIYENKELLK